MKCWKCDTEIPDAARFCTECGAEQTKPPAPPAGGVDNRDGVMKAGGDITGGGGGTGQAGIDNQGGVMKAGGDIIGGSKYVSHDQHVHLHGAEPVECPLCGRRNDPKDTFRCRQCDAADLCVSHLVPGVRVCELCAARQQEQHSGRAPEIIEALADVANPVPPFAARVWVQPEAERRTRDIVAVPRASKGAFRIGDRFTLNACADRDCHLTLLDMGTSGNVYVLLQNHPLRAGQAAALTGPDAGHEWLVGGPPGIERLKAFFTLEPLALFPGTGSFTPLSAERRTRDIVARIRNAGSTLGEMPPSAWADAACEFVVAPSGPAAGQ